MSIGFICNKRKHPFGSWKWLGGLTDNQQLPGESETHGVQINKPRQELVNSYFVMLEKQQMLSTEYIVSHF